MTINQRFIDMYHNGWTLSELARMCGVSKTTMHNWVKEGTPSGEPTPLSNRMIKKRGEQTITTYTTVPADDLKKMREYHKSAKRVSNRTAEDARERFDSLALNNMIKYHVDNRMVPISVIARLLSVTPRAIRARYHG